jgi:hypothetical protein
MRESSRERRTRPSCRVSCPVTVMTRCEWFVELLLPPFWAEPHPESSMVHLYSDSSFCFFIDSSRCSR